VQATRRGGVTKFLQLVEEAGLNPQLVAYGPYTIFAPSDEAIDKRKETKVVRLHSWMSNYSLAFGKLTLSKLNANKNRWK